MNHKTFISQNGWFRMTLPFDWEEYEDNEDDTYAFFNTKSWTGNFRLTPLLFTNSTNPEGDIAAKFIEEKLKKIKMQ